MVQLLHLYMITGKTIALTRCTFVMKVVAHMVKRLPTMRETRVQSLGREDSLEKEIATHSTILDWEIPWTEEPGRLQSMGSQKSQTQFRN